MKPEINARLCPNCRRLISNDETKCPYCGTAYPNFFLKQIYTKLFVSETVITGIILINAFMFSASIVVDIAKANLDINPLAFLSPGTEALLWMGASGTFPVINYGHWWSILTANYLHGGLLHIILNMMALNQIGSLVVREFGVSRFWIIYTVSGMMGFTLSLLMNVPFTIGASASICGLIGAGCYFGKSHGGEYGQAIYRDISGWILGLFLIGFLVDGINNWAHAGGLLSGLLFAWLLGYEVRYKDRKVFQWLAICCVGSTLLALIWGVGVAVYRIDYLGF